MTKSILISVMMLLGLPQLVLLQQAAGSLNGVVSDRQGALVPGVKVVMTPTRPSSRAAPREFESETDYQGRFHLKNLPAGIYDVRLHLGDRLSGIVKTVLIPQGKVVEIAIEMPGGCSGIKGAGRVTDADKADVVRQSLLQAISPKRGLLSHEQIAEGVILSTRNIRAQWIRNLHGVKLILLSQKQIQRKANASGEVLYLSFPEITIRGQCIATTVTNTWAVGRHSPTGKLSGGGLTFEYRKESGNWKGKFITGWVS